MSEDTEMVQRGIGILTATLSWEPEDPAATAMFKESLKTLTGLDDALSVSFTGGSPEQAALLREWPGRSSRPWRPTALASYSAWRSGFKSVADAYRADVPSANIEGILHARLVEPCGRRRPRRVAPR